MELFDYDANYDPERDQPGYRRDRDPLAPAGSTWAEMKKQLGVKDPDQPADPPASKPAEKSEAATDGGAPAGESLTPEQEHEATLRELQERLSAAGIAVSLGELQSRSDADILAATLWLNWYTDEDAKAPYLERPSWIPSPDDQANKGDEK
jgi:hypothetical protein